MAQQNFGVISKVITLAAGETKDFFCFDYIYLLESTGTVSISSGGTNGFAPLPLRSGLMGRHAWAGKEGQIGNVTLKNETGGGITFTVQTGFGAPMDNRGGTASGQQSVSIDGVTSTVPVKGGVAHGAAVSDAPVLLGAEARDSERAATVVGRVCRLFCDLVGRLIVAPFSNPENLISNSTAAAAGAGGSVVLVAAQAAGVCSTLHALTVNNTNAVPTEWELLDGATVKWSGSVAANASDHVNWPGGLRGSAATAWNLRQTAAGAIKGSASGHKGV